MKQIHPLQMDILRKLLFAPYLKYSEIKPGDMENSQFIFHLDKLIEEILVEKSEDGYRLTVLGKEFANRMDSIESKMKSFPKTTTILCGYRDGAEEKEYLVYKRLKNPFYGGQGFPTQKVWFGDKICDAAKRGLKEETNLDGKPELIAIRHYHVYLEDKQLVEDKIMYMFAFHNPIGEVKGNVEGEFNWIKDSEISNFIKNPFPEFYESFELLKEFKGEVSFKEIDQYTNKF